MRGGGNEERGSRDAIAKQIEMASVEPGDQGGGVSYSGASGAVMSSSSP